MVRETDKIEMYSRMLALQDFSKEDLESLEQTTVTVVGAGGLGSPVLRLLTAMGFGKIRIIDHDVVELSNLQRQTVYEYSDVGSPKADAAASNLSRYNPFIELEPVGMSINKDNARELLRGSDIILDGLDSMTARRAVNEASYTLKIPYVYAGAIEYYGNISTFIPDETGCFYCLVGDTEDNPENACANVGVSPTLLSVVAAIEVQEAISLAIGEQPNLAGKLMHVDVQNLGFDTFEIARSDTCPVCSLEKDTVPSEQKGLNITMLCSNSFSISPPSKLNLDLTEIASHLDGDLRHIKRKTSLIVKYQSGTSITLMMSGSAVVKGAKDQDDAIDIYNSLVKN